MERLRVLFREIGRKARFRRRFGRHGPTAAEREHQADIGHQLAGMQRDRQTLIFQGLCFEPSPRQDRTTLRRGRGLRLGKMSVGVFNAASTPNITISNASTTNE
jgi:hypothetical protein